MPTVKLNKVEESFAIRLHGAMRDLAEHKPVIYWCDFLTSILLFWLSFWAACALDSEMTLIAFAVAVFSLYRSASFIHEIVHVSSRRLPLFAGVWSVLCGMPLCLPYHFYRSHLSHHSEQTYGTTGDPEYLFLRHQRWIKVGTLLLLLPFVPILLYLRFALIAPLAWLHPSLRRFVDERLSSIVLHSRYQFRLPRSNKEKRASKVWEAIYCVFAITVLAGVFTHDIKMHVVIIFYSTVVVALTINFVRTLLAHRYQGDGRPMSVAAQVIDSTTIASDRWWVQLFAPLGLQYHALHHILPYLPYHALPIAHRRFMAQAGNVSALYQRTLLGAQRKPMTQHGTHSDAQQSNQI